MNKEVIVKWSSSAPANLMLMGEHSVVYGHTAIACALSQRIHIDWQTREDDQILIQSTLGHYQTTRQALPECHAPSKLIWVIRCLQHYQIKLKTGLSITIKSDFSDTLGLGSSAAVLAAMLGGLDYFVADKPVSLGQQFATGLKIIHKIQGRGSGTDLAASLHGGIIHFQPKTQQIDQLATHLDLSLVYCGYKTPTAEVLQQVVQDWAESPAQLQKLYQLMGDTTQLAYHALCQQNWNQFSQQLNRYQGLMDTLGVNDATLSHIVYSLRQDPNISASKISGSGLGDCVIALGKMSEDTLTDYQKIHIQVQPLGLDIQPL
ncbi:GHMP kinase [Hydrogenovibrio sp. SC-1]|nr:GHMP kinase [Hydrogenovibrio sp. SC-1]